MFPKLSMLALYATCLEGQDRRGMRNTLRAMSAFVVVCYCASLFDDTFFCGKDVSEQWSQQDGACSVFYAQEPFILNFTLGLACHLLIYSFPLLLYYHGWMWFC